MMCHQRMGSPVIYSSGTGIGRMIPSEIKHWIRPTIAMRSNRKPFGVAIVRCAALVVKLCLAISLVAMTGCAHSGDARHSGMESMALCSDAWYQFIDKQVSTGDGHGHGPDIGSDEWKSVVEFKLGIRGRQDVPERNSEAWCRHIEQIIGDKPGLPSSTSSYSAKGNAASFTCHKFKEDSIEKMICDDEELALLDNKLAEVYSAALEKAVNQYPPRIKAEQRGWIKGRNDCWKAADKRVCVRREYERRIAELQAQYRLVTHTAPVHFVCDGNPAKEVVATFFQTHPPTLIAELGDSVSLMFRQPSASGSKYQGRNETLWEHQGQATIFWGYQAEAMVCSRVP